MRMLRGWQSQVRPADVKRGTSGSPAESERPRSRRKILAMAAQFQPDESGVESPRSSVEDDAAALRELVEQMKLTQPLHAGEELQLLEKAARGDRASEDRLVAGHLPVVIRIAGDRGDQ